MAQLRTLDVLTTASGAQAASLPAQFVRLQEFSGTLAGKANTVHRHTAADIDNLIPMLLALLGENAEESQSVIWDISGTVSARVRLKPNGGVLVDGEGLFVDPTVVSVPGHEHPSSDITDFQTALYQKLEQLFAASPTIGWSFDGNDISGTVRLRSAGGILETSDGLALDFGSGTNQVARGDHGHSQLHDPVTLGSSASVDLALAAQRLSAEVRLAPASAMLIDAGGLRVDLGSGTNQAARGDHSHGLLHNPVSVASDASLSLAISAQQLLSGTVRLDPTPPGGFGKIARGSAGLSVALGTAADQAAAGNHGHSVATESAPGFLSIADKTRLDTLWNNAPSGTLTASGTMDSLRVRILYLVNVNTGQQRAIYLDDLGNVQAISGTLTLPAPVLSSDPFEENLLWTYSDIEPTYWNIQRSSDGVSWNDFSLVGGGVRTVTPPNPYYYRIYGVNGAHQQRTNISNSVFVF